MSALPTFQLYPERISQDNNECILLLSAPVNEQDITISLQIMGEPAMIIENRRDPRTGSFFITVPDEYFQNEIIMVYIQYKDTMIGCARLTVDKPCEQLARVLEKALDPIQLMMSALGLKTGSEADLKTLDGDLANVVEKNIPPSHLRVLFNDYNNAQPTSGDISTRSRFPTALHFSAHYGFTKLTEKLMYCPGSKAALMVVNKEGNTPRDMAQNSGQQQILRAFEKKATEHDEDYASVADLYGEDSMSGGSDTGMYWNMGPINKDAARWSHVSKVTMGPTLPNTPPPPRPRTNSIGTLQAIREVEPTPELRDSGIFVGSRDSNLSAGSRTSGESLPPMYEEDTPDGQIPHPKGSKLQRSKAVTIRRGDTINNTYDNTPPSLGHRPSKRPSLPNIHMAGSNTVPSKPDDTPPPCQGAIYQNQSVVMPPNLSHRKMSLPGSSLDINELQNSEFFRKRKNVIPS